MYTKPTLHDYKGDTSKAWYVSFLLQDELGRWKEVQRRGGINYEKDKKERYKEGRALVKALEERLKEGWRPGGNKDIPQTLREAVGLVISLKETSLKPKSIRNYKDITRLLLTWMDSNGYKVLPLFHFTHSLARKYLDHLITVRKYSGKTHNNTFGILRSIFNVMKERKWISENPFNGVQTLPTDTGRNIAYSEQEARELIEFFKKEDKRLYYAVNFVFHGFIRKTELCSLRIRDIDGRAIRMNSRDTKNRKQESVTITHGLIEVLKEMELDKLNPEWYIFGVGLVPGPKRNNRPDDLSDLHLKLKKKSGNLDNSKTFYSWRHAGAIAYYNATNDLVAISRQLRHSDVRITMIYLKSLGLQPNMPFIEARVTI